MKILIATYPFGLCGTLPIDMLNDTGWEIYYNSLGRRLNGNEVRDMLVGVDAVIAGTEPYNDVTLKRAKDLKVISRVGIGLDSIDFDICNMNNIKVVYTPEAPSDSVADLTIAQILNLLRGIHISDKSIKEGRWKRVLGVSIQQINIGVLGVGRIGSRVIERLKPFGANILACDLTPSCIDGVKWVDHKTLFKESDLVTIHIPLNKDNYHYIGLNELSMMKSGSYIVNTSRGKVVDEKYLEYCLYNQHLSGAALDVFENEPYSGVLNKLDNVILTAHIGASDRRSRYLMELGAVENCLAILRGQPSEYLITVED